MTSQTRQWSERDLEQALLDLRDHVAYPPTPDLEGVVLARLREQVATPGPSTWLRLSQAWPRLAMAACIALVLGLAVVILVPEVRTAVAQRLGLAGVMIREVGIVEGPPSAGGTAGERLALGERLLLDEAQARVEFRIVLPTVPLLSVPDEVYVDHQIPGRGVTFVYYPRPDLPEIRKTGIGLLMTQFEATPRVEASVAVLGKDVGPQTRVSAVSVNGSPGYWIEGQPHSFNYADREGRFRSETVRFAGDVLLWEQNRLTLRIESGLGREQTIAIAASVR